MPVCKFYLQGCCKFGNNCNFDHPRDQQGYSGHSHRQSYQQQQPQYHQQTNNQYRYVGGNQSSHHQQQQQQYQQVKPSQQPVDVHNLSDKEFLEYIRKELSDWINSSAWKLSCYSYTKSAPCIPVLEDISPEEVRWSLYEAKKNNSFNQVNNEYMMKVNQTVDMIKQMINPNQQIKDYLLNYFHESEKIIKQSSQASSSTSSAQDNPFMKIVQQKLQQQQQPQQTFFSPPQPQQQFQQFGTSQTQFGQIQQTQHQSFPQTQMVNQATGMVFFQNQPSSQPFQNNNSFNQINFKTNQEQQSPLFKLGNQPTQPSQTMALNGNIFSQIVNMNTTPQKENTFFGQVLPLTQPQQQTQFQSQNQLTNQFNNIQNQNNINYSNMNEINNQDLEQFKSNEFTIGRIPQIPPPRELC